MTDLNQVYESIKDKERADLEKQYCEAIEENRRLKDRLNQLTYCCPACGLTIQPEKAV